MVRANIFGAVVCTILCVSPSLVFASSTPCPFVWPRNMGLGSTGADVLKLQQFLNLDGESIAPSGPGSSGEETDIYGTLTAKAVSSFQMKYASQVLTPAGLSSGSGFFGTRTRAQADQLCISLSASPSASAAAESQPILTVTAAGQPSPTLAPAGAGGVPFTSFTLTAGGSDETVNSVTVERTGPGEDGAFSDVALNDENGDAIGDTKTFNAAHKVVFDQPFTIPANTSETFTVTGDMAGDLSAFDGEMPILQVDAIAASVPVSGSLPIQGTPQTLNNSLVIGGALASLSPYDPNGPTNRYIGDKGIIFSGIRVTANSTEDLTLSSIAWDQAGSAGPQDIANVSTIVNGVSYPTEQDGHSYTSTFTPGIVIPKGQTVDVYIRGDLASTGANRTVEFDIDDSGDIALTGNAYGFGVGISPEGDTAENGNSVFLTSDGTPQGDEGPSFFAGSVATINPGTLISVGNAQ
ncbi:MAG TPA: peptidoglycan-binding domain-containing protein [Candidatus Paceibacterota bacterium]|nr:peptidoglycan-binding domain-containing protein [Candidatus Paceibacterota bacterium]